MAEFASSVEIEARAEEVFEFLTTPRGVTAWMGEHAVLDARKGGVFEVNIAGSPIRGEFLEVDRPHRVVVSWGVAGSAELPVGASRVSFTLVPTLTGTRVDLLHSELPNILVAGHVDGWMHFLPRLAAAAQGSSLGVDDWVPLRHRGSV